MLVKKVKIGISAKQYEGDVSFDSEPMVMNVLCEALLTENGDEFSIEYDERVSEDGGVTHTKLVFGKGNPGRVSMVRTGEINMSCTFFAGGRCNCNYSVSSNPRFLKPFSSFKTDNNTAKESNCNTKKKF